MLLITKGEGLGATGGAVLGFYVGGPVGAGIGAVIGWFGGRAIEGHKQGTWISIYQYRDVHERVWDFEVSTPPAPKGSSDWIRKGLPGTPAVRVKADATEWTVVGPLLDNV
jgi:hypothetical protein